MDRGFGDVRGAYREWERGQHAPGPFALPDDALALVTDAALRAAARAVLDARDWADGRLGDAALEGHLFALFVAVAGDAWRAGAAREP
jgi:hypothetical protein